MIKKIAGTFAFFFMGFVLFLGLRELLGPDEEYSEMMFQGFYDTPDNTLDAVFIGNSHTYKFWQGAFAWEELGIATSEVATSSMPGSTMKNVAIEVLKTQKPKVLVMDITPFANIDKENNKVHLLIDNMKFSMNYLDMIENYCKYTGVTGMEKMQFYLPIIQFHPRWKELTEKDFTQTRPSYINSNYQRKFMKKKQKEKTEHTSTEEREKIGENNEAALREFLEWCTQQEVPVQFVAVPILREKNLAKINYAGDIVKEYGVEFVDCNEEDMFESFGFDIKTDFEDINHTNVKGSFKFTKVYGEYLMKNYGLKDRWGEAEYASWDEKAEEYYAIVGKYLNK